MNEKNRKYIREYILNRYRRDKSFRERIKKKTLECQKKRRDKWIKQGLCSKCGNKKVDKKWRTCELCRI